MIGVSAYRTSRAAQWVHGAATTQYFLRTPAEGPHTLEHAATLRLLPKARPLILPTTLLVLAASTLYGNVPLGIMVGVFLIAFYRPTLALGLTPALLIWAPRLPVMVLGDETLFLRLDHGVIAGMLVALATDQHRPLRTPPAHTALNVFLLAILASIVAGVFQGTLETPTSALLYFAQWLTWYGIFIAAYTLAPRLGVYGVYAWALPLVALAAYGLAESIWPFYEDPHVRYRTFERGLFPGQANHAGGLFALATVTGLTLAIESRHRALGLGLALLSTAALWPTGSRSGVLAWIAGIATLALLYARPLRWWTLPVALLGIAALPSSLWYRFSAPGSSMYDRLVAWKSALSTVADYPLLGLGAGARHRSYYDNQYLMTLAESGFLGMLSLLVFLAVLFRALRHAPADQPAATWMATGTMAAIAVLAVHSLATATFVVTLVAGPFFWFCGVALGTRGARP